MRRLPEAQVVIVDRVSPGIITLVKSAAAFGVPGLLGLLVVIEAGIPLPIPGDLLMLLVGERAAAGAFPLWAAAAGLELVGIVGTSALFFGVRGAPGSICL